MVELTHQAHVAIHIAEPGTQADEGEILLRLVDGARVALYRASAFDEAKVIPPRPDLYAYKGGVTPAMVSKASCLRCGCVRSSRHAGG